MASSKTEILAAHQKLIKQISKLYSTYTPVVDIQELLRQAEAAKDNELRSITQ
jgi:hypothetical protein